MAEDITTGLAALFAAPLARKAAAPSPAPAKPAPCPAPPPAAKPPAAPAPAPAAKGRGLTAFLDAMAKALPAPDAAPKVPFVVPEIMKAPAPTSGIDVRQAAEAAMAPERAAEAARAVASGEAPAVQRQTAFTYDVPGGRGFKGIAGVGKKKKPDEPHLNIPKPVAKSLADLFKLDEEPVFRKGSKMDEARRREGVKDSTELRRILKVARRVASTEPLDLTDRFRKASGTMKLFPIQSRALFEMRNAGGLFGPIGVGAGKTLTSLLAGEAMDAKLTVILVPPALRAQLLTVDIPRLSKHWQIPLARIRVVAYSQLSSAGSADILEELKPDLIVADEAHSLRYRTAARTKRFLRYMKAHPECRFVPLSGTMTRRSLNDYQHLAELALGKNSPLPNHFPTLSEWAEALDVSDDPMPPGALLGLCNDAELAAIAANDDPEAVQKIVREAFRRRVVETPGVVATEESSIGTSLVISALRPTVPGEVQRTISEVRTRWVIGEEELTDPLAVARVTRQLAAGFYYRPVWPGGIPDSEWLLARRDWNREVREILKRSKKGLDSPMLIAQAIERGEYASDFYDAWRAVKDRPEPPREAVWISDFLAREAIQWAKDNATKATPGIIWYSHDALGRKIAELSGFPFFGPGTKASEELTRVDVKKTPVIICSVKAHSVGKNLQQFSLNLFTTPISSGADAEQAIARTHRPGQEADEVRIDVFVHTTETLAAFRSSVRDAAYIEETQGQRQKLNFADKLGFGENAFEFGNQSASEIETAGITWNGSAASLFKARP